MLGCIVNTKAAMESKERVEALKALNDKIEHYESVLNQQASQSSLSKQTHMMSIAMFDLIESLRGSQPAGPELQKMREAAAGDSVITGVLDSLPERLAYGRLNTIIE